MSWTIGRDILHAIVLTALLAIWILVCAIRAITQRPSLRVVSLQICYVVVYNAFFHHLAMIPGPLLAKYTNLYAAYHAWRGDIHIDVWRCHQTYGDRVRYGPNRIIINSPRALHDIYGHGARVKKYKGYSVLAAQAPNMLTLSDKTQHSRRRRVISQAFSESSLRLFEPLLLNRIHRFCASLRTQVEAGRDWSKPLDMASQFHHLTFDSMTGVAFGVDYATIEDPKFRYVKDAIMKANVRLSVTFQEAKLDFARLDRKLFRESALAGLRFVKFLRKLLGTRLANNTESKDIFWFLQQCRDPDTGEALSVKELSTETATFLIAGSDTTSTTMSALSYYLSAHPQYYARVANEVRTTFSDPDEICLGPKLNSCHFLRACLDESLRLSPPGGAAFWRTVESGGAYIDGEYFPQGTEVGIGIYALQHHADHWDAAFEFVPERWTKGKTEDLHQSDTRLPYFPFGQGSRSCVGKPLALNQIMLTFAFLFMEFDFRTAHTLEGREDMTNGGAVPEFVLKEHISGQAKGPVLCFRRRQ
ncbi:cytochrome P450 [Xylariaceae sp. FL1019]|nr:cytochrome P450 [Xylariaceae sp. FL1019]